MTLLNTHGNQVTVDYTSGSPTWSESTAVFVKTRFFSFCFSICISKHSQEMLILLSQGPHFRNHLVRVCQLLLKAVDNTLSHYSYRGENLFSSWLPLRMWLSHPKDPNNFPLTFFAPGLVTNQTTKKIRTSLSFRFMQYVGHLDYLLTSCHSPFYRNHVFVVELPSSRNSLD